MNYNIRLAKQEDIPKLKHFLSKAYSPNHLITNYKYLDWQYKDIPFNPFAPNYSNLLLFKEDRIVGHLGLIPYIFFNNGKEYKVAFLASLIVEEGLRGFGAGIFLTREAEKYFDALYTTGFNKQASSALEFCKWSREHILKRWVYMCGATSKNFDTTEITEIDKFDEKWDESWKTLQKEYSFTINRSKKYLNWRFKNNPFIGYKIFMAKDSSGYIVLRREDGDEFKIYRIVDFISSPESSGALIKAAINCANKEGVDFLDFFCNGDIYGKVLEGVGFFLYNPEVDSEPPVFILPIDRSRLKINFAYKFVNLELKTYMSEDWFVVKSDGDKDRAY